MRFTAIFAGLILVSSASAQVIYAPPTPTVSYDRSHDNLYPPNSPQAVLRMNRLPYAVNFYVPYSPPPAPAIVAETYIYTPAATSIAPEALQTPIVVVERSDSGYYRMSDLTPSLTPPVEVEPKYLVITPSSSAPTTQPADANAPHRGEISITPWTGKPTAR